MRVLITGSGGLIGGFLAKELLAQGHTVLAAYRKTLPKLAEHARSRLRLIQVDLAKTADGLEPADLVVHAAAHTHLIPNSTASDYVHSNLVGTLRLLDYIKMAPPKLFIYLSAMSVYGDVMTGELDEETPLGSPDLYGATKYVAERIVRSTGGTYPALCVRLPGVVGPGYFTPWIGQIVQTAVRHEPVRIYHPDAFFNNVVDLQEVTRFITFLMERGTSGVNLVTLAASEPLRIRDVVALILELTGSRSEIVVMDQADKPSFTIRTDRVRDRLGFHPATTREIIHRYVTQNVFKGAIMREGKAPSEERSSREAAVSAPGR